MENYKDINERSMNQNIIQAIEKNRKLNLEFKLVKLHSIKTGICAEDCAFCGQSKLVKKKYKIIKPFSSINDFYLAIENAKKNSVNEILFVSSGRTIRDKSELKKLAKGISKARKEKLEVGLDNGLMDQDNIINYPKLLLQDL
jgi:biotin synthase-like enzyme